MMGGQMGCSAYVHKLSNVKNAGVLCMVAESEYLHWVMNGTGFNPSSSVVDGETLWMPAIAARHGKITSNGHHGLTNIAFFDGHVASLDTRAIATYTDAASGKGGGPNIPQSVGVVFTMARAR